MTMTTLQIALSIAFGTTWLLGIPVARGHRLRGTSDPEWYTYGLWLPWAITAAIVGIFVGLWWIVSTSRKWLENWGYRLGPEG